MVIDVDRIPELDALTLAAIKASAMRLALRDPEIMTTEKSTEERLRILGVALGEVCTLAAEGMPKDRLSVALIGLAARALIWAEVSDKIPEATMGLQHNHRRGTPCAGYPHVPVVGGNTWLS